MKFSLISLIAAILALTSACAERMEPQKVLSSESIWTDADGNTYETGFIQASANNQNPVITRKDASGTVIWKQEYERSGVDGRGVLIFGDEAGRIWAVFTVDGGDVSDKSIIKYAAADAAFSGTYQGTYGSGGGPKVSVICEINPSDGQVLKGTFLTARLNSGKTNTLKITSIGEKEGRLALEVSSSAWPPGRGRSYVRFPDITDADRTDGSFLLFYEMDKSLSEILAAQLR